MNDLSVLRKGDIISAGRTVEVAHDSTDGSYRVILRDVQNGVMSSVWTNDLGTWHYEMVKKAAKPVAEGDELTAAEANAAKWKPTSVLVGPAGFIFVMGSDGRWVSPSKVTYDGGDACFDAGKLPRSATGATYKVLYLP